MSTGGRSSIVAVPNTSVADHKQSTLDVDPFDYRYVAPEVQWPEYYHRDEVLITKQSDVFEMAMVIYEASPYRGLSGPVVQAHPRFPGLIGE